MPERKSLAASTQTAASMAGSLPAGVVLVFMLMLALVYWGTRVIGSGAAQA